MEAKHCDKNTESIKPPKFSPHDKYAALTREAKAEERKKEGLL